MCGTFHHDARFDVALQLQIVQQPTLRECIAKYYEITAIHVYWLDCIVIVVATDPNVIANFKPVAKWHLIKQRFLCAIFVGDSV
jgi:hypothetical protein